MTQTLWENSASVTEMPEDGRGAALPLPSIKEPWVAAVPRSYPSGNIMYDPNPIIPSKWSSPLRVRSHVADPQQIFRGGFGVELVADFCPLTSMWKEISALVAAGYELWICLQIFCGFYAENLLRICNMCSLGHPAPR